MPQMDIGSFNNFAGLTVVLVSILYMTITFYTLPSTTLIKGYDFCNSKLKDNLTSSKFDKKLFYKSPKALLTPKQLS